MNNENIIFANRYKLLLRQQFNDVYEWWKAEDIKTKNIISIKCTKNHSVTTAGAALLKEYLLLTQVQHPNLLMPLHYDDYEGQSYIVFPFADGFSLKDELLHESLLQETEAIRMIQTIGEAIHALHQHHILHRNIFPANIFKINQQYILGQFKRSSDTISTIENMPYLAPELFSETPEYTEKSDVFALGVVVFQLCTDILPWQGLGGIALLKGAAVPQLPNRFSTDFSNLLMRCMAIHPKERPELQEIFNLFSKENVNISKDIITELQTESIISNVTTPTPIVNEEAVQTLVSFQVKSNKKNTISNNNKKVLIVLILLLFLSGAVWAYFMIQNNQGHKNLVAETNTAYNNMKSETNNFKTLSQDSNTDFIDTIKSGSKKKHDKYANRKLDLVPFRIETGKYGFKDWRKKKRIKPQYDDVFEFQEYIAAVKQNGAWGYIDTNGRMIIPNIYTKALNFKNGVAVVEKDNYIFKINKNGNCVEGCSTANSSLE